MQMISEDPECKLVPNKFNPQPVVTFCPAALRRQPAGDRRAVQAVIVTAPTPARVPAGSLHQPGARRQVSVLGHRQGETQLNSHWSHSTALTPPR